MSCWYHEFPEELNITKWDDLVLTYSFIHDEMFVSYRKTNRRLLLLLP